MMFSVFAASRTHCADQQLQPTRIFFRGYNPDYTCHWMDLTVQGLVFYWLFNENAKQWLSLSLSSSSSPTSCNQLGFSTIQPSLKSLTWAFAWVSLSIQHLNQLFATQCYTILYAIYFISFWDYVHIVTLCSTLSFKCAINKVAFTMMCWTRVFEKINLGRLK